MMNRFLRRRRRVLAARLLAFGLLAAAPGVTPAAANVWYDLDRAEIRSENHEQAREHLELAVEMNADHSSAWYWLGWVELELGTDLPSSIAAFRRHLSIDPVDGWAHNDLGVAYERSGQYLDALLSYTRAVALAPSALHRSNFGNMLMRHERPDLAFEQYMALAAMDDSGAEEWRGRLLERIYPDP